MRPRYLIAAAAVLLALNVAVAIAQRPDAFGGSREHQAIQYNTAPNDTAFTALNAKIESGSVTFTFDPVSGYLRSALDALNLPIESQVLVYTGTSLQSPKIRMDNPRAIFFSDTVAIAFIRGAPLLEAWAQDPRQGAVFYTMDQQPGGGAPHFKRELNCLSCHLSWDTLAVPGPFLLTTFPRKTERDYANGFMVDHRVSLAERWGGWYVTGKQAPAHHMGNLPLFVPDPEALRTLRPQAPKTSLSSIAALFDRTGYPTPYSDIVALMVLEHQSHVLNLITRVGWEARVGNTARVPEAASDLVDYMLFVDEAPIEGRIEGSSGFAETFSAQGPRDSRGRSLRELQLSGRLMKYPLSYMIYAPPFDALPAVAKDAVLARLERVLAGEDHSPKYAHLTPPLRQAIVEILKDTKGGAF